MTRKTCTCCRQGHPSTFSHACRQRLADMQRGMHTRGQEMHARTTHVSMYARMRLDVRFGLLWGQFAWVWKIAYELQTGLQMVSNPKNIGHEDPKCIQHGTSTQPAPISTYVAAFQPRARCRARLAWRISAWRLWRLIPARPKKMRRVRSLAPIFFWQAGGGPETRDDEGKGKRRGRGSAGRTHA